MTRTFNQSHHRAPTYCVLSSLAVAAMSISLAMSSGCEKKDAPVAKSPSPAKAPAPAEAPVMPAEAKIAPQTTPFNLGEVDLATLDLQIPSQDDLDTQALKDISSQNADATYKELEQEINDEPG